MSTNLFTWQLLLVNNFSVFLSYTLLHICRPKYDTFIIALFHLSVILKINASPPIFYINFYSNNYDHVPAVFVVVNLMWFGLLLIASWSGQAQIAKYKIFHSHCSDFQYLTYGALFELFFLHANAMFLRVCCVAHCMWKYRSYHLAIMLSSTRFHLNRARFEAALLTSW